MDKLKHIVQTRLLSCDMGGGLNLLDEKLIERRVGYMMHHLVPSLNNQTNLDFEFMLLINPEWKVTQLYDLQRQFERMDLKFKYRFVPHTWCLDDYLIDVWQKNDVVILSRIDDDDFANKFSIQDTRDVLNANPDSDIVLCGYNSGYKFAYLQDGPILDRYYGHRQETGGHHSVFQSAIINTHKVKKFNCKLCPLFCNHTKTMQQMGRYGKITYVDIPREDGYLYFRHMDSNQVGRIGLKNMKFAHSIPLTDELKKKLTDEFAVKFD